MDLGDQRRSYSMASIDIETVDASPFQQFENWFLEAESRNLLEPNAMVLSTVDSDNQPSQRTVLLKLFDESGFVFFTNYNSRKASHIKENPSVSILFPWYPLQRQVEISGHIERVSTAESAKYFAVRPRGSQLGAWVSHQSSVVSNRAVLMSKLTELKNKFLSGEIPMPDFWGGFRLVPRRFEFWQGGLDRLHDRIEYRRGDQSGSWTRQRLAP